MDATDPSPHAPAAPDLAAIYAGFRESLAESATLLATLPAEAGTPLYVAIFLFCSAWMISLLFHAWRFITYAVPPTPGWRRRRRRRRAAHKAARRNDPDPA